MRFGVSRRAQVRAVEAGHADWGRQRPPGLLSGAAHTVREPVAPAAIPTTDFIQFNTTLAPFDDVRVRGAQPRDRPARDRATLRRPGRDADMPGPAAGLPGYRPYCPYTERRTAPAAGTGPTSHEPGASSRRREPAGRG